MDLNLTKFFYSQLEAINPGTLQILVNKEKGTNRSKIGLTVNSRHRQLQRPIALLHQDRPPNGQED